VTSTEVFRNPANTDHPVHDLIRERWSPRAFADRPVEREKLHSLFEAARWAASAGNQQPWFFIFVTREHPEEFAQFASILFERNMVWAQEAPVLILITARLYEAPGKEYVSYYDTGMAAANLAMQAVGLGLNTHQMGGFDSEKAREVLHIPAGYDPITVMALGYPGSPETLPDHLREREIAPRTRKPLEDFVFENGWDQPAPDAAVE
jgi:nitroreductase